ncbi:PHP domain-containing protein [Rhodococcus sp. D2-41]|uniref:PHP domain-containing protein n=1 Tax=Speluncibacter jeojiensis TaxID=2710754 RepID=A0A9X4M1Y5_9ACTN|nr:PHP domain-containing protein [Rhodococcus sp. D2-41]MDG3012521.1 PHP domain-containing protein [Rhodococcus sp. D2-41]MDG3015362.1 PHP domain-containing protein [Corynebacteriales bacterium D3-21]
MRIDLHTHTNASDGTDTPTELMRNAAAAGLDVVAVTDHDTTDAWREAAAALPDGMTLIRGMEMSCEGRDERGRPVAVHLLAYLFDPDHADLAAERRRLRTERATRIRAMATRMADAGLPIDPQQVLADAGPSAGRPHLAQALIRAGVVASTDEAFAGPLSARSPYFVDKVDTPLEDAVAMIAAAGGVSVLAHARAATRGRLMAVEQIRELAGAGLGGLEVDHPEHGEQDRALLTRVARDHDLIVTGSSDYHGRNKTVELGRCTTAPGQLDAIVARASGVGVLVGGAPDAAGRI